MKFISPTKIGGAIRGDGTHEYDFWFKIALIEEFCVGKS